MSDNRPIGIFDSGIGGLTVVHEVFDRLPREQIIYFGDTARVPYGSKSHESVKKFAIQDILFLMQKNKNVVMGLLSLWSVYHIGRVERLNRGVLFE